jgi:alkanesulfonate monooxygenase SsuD/methylene tetrahydromethanopterin reductase-like flavin-dependent oxidoreductase (luciferase family)
VLIGVTLPSFRDDAYALDAARIAERLGLDGVFSFDHLWPMGQPERPALSAMPFLGAVAAATDRVTVGSLVARIGLLSDAMLVASLRSIDNICAGRFIAGLGVGDHLSAAENMAFGIPFAPKHERLASLRLCASRLIDEGTSVWIGCGSHISSPTIDIAADVGAEVNVWGVPADDVGLLCTMGFAGVTWAGTAGRPQGLAAGQAPGPKIEPTVDAMADHLTAIGAAGARWAVCGWPAVPEQLAEAAALVRRRLG